VADVKLTNDMRTAFDNAIADRAPVMVATSGAGGMPDIAFKGSAMIWDDDHIAFWERALGTTLRNMEENPQVCLMYRNAETRTAWKFFGVATLHPEGETRQQVMDRTIQLELDRDPERKGVAVVIRIDKVIQLGQVIMERATW
jgi:predicted pyridoxine 5'-phosphate oxidase superfamily flavin-nucleotide-binding protein